MKYDKHRKLLLDDILASMARLPSSKQSLRSYRLNSQEHIQILSALVLQLIQSMSVLPKNAASKRSSVSLNHQLIVLNVKSTMCVYISIKSESWRQSP